MELTTSEAEGRRWMRVAAATAACVVGSGPLLQFSFGVFAHPVGVALGATPSGVSLALGAGMFGAGIATPVAGWLMDRWGLARVAVPGALALVAALLAIAFATQSLTTFILLYALMGIASSVLTPLPFAKMVVSLFRERAGLALGITMAGVGLGGALLPQLASHLTARQGWRGGYVGLALAVLLIGIPCTIVALRGVDHVATATRSLEDVGPAHPFRGTTFWMLALCFFLMAMACNGTVGHLIQLVAATGVSPQVAVGAVSAAGLAVIAGRLASGLLLDRFATHRVAAALFMPPLIGILILLNAHSFGAAMFGAVLVGLGLGAEVDLMGYLIRTLFGLRRYGVIYGFAFLLFTLGSATGPLVMGLSLLHGGYAGALICFVIALLIGAGLVFRFAQPSR